VPTTTAVVEPLRRLGVRCAAPGGGIEFDLSWSAAYPAVQEEPHLLLAATRPILDASRFSQLGSWSGRLRLPRGVTDHIAHASLDGEEGRGMLEHATMGRHDPTGFAD
jgi:hypothetical protein